MKSLKRRHTLSCYSFPLQPCLLTAAILLLLLSIASVATTAEAHSWVKTRTYKQSMTEPKEPSEELSCTVSNGDITISGQDLGYILNLVYPTGSSNTFLMGSTAGGSAYGLRFTASGEDVLFGYHHEPYDPGKWSIVDNLTMEAVDMYEGMIRIEVSIKLPESGKYFEKRCSIKNIGDTVLANVKFYDYSEPNANSHEEEITEYDTSRNLVYSTNTQGLQRYLGVFSPDLTDGHDLGAFWGNGVLERIRLDQLNNASGPFAGDSGFAFRGSLGNLSPGEEKKISVYFVCEDNVDNLKRLVDLIGNAPPNTEIKTHEIDSSNGTAKFTWSGSDDSTPSAQLVYEHRLLNPDSPLYGWSDWSSSTTATYPRAPDTRLPDGTYRFQVKAKDADGAIQPNPTTWKFTIGLEDHPPTTSASDLSGQPTTMHPNTVYSVSAKYYDPNGREDLKHCYMRLNHPEKPLTLMWYQTDGHAAPWAGEEGENYLTITGVDDTEISKGYKLTWDFKINDSWPEVEDAIDFGVFASDDGDLESGWHYDDTKASFTTDTTTPALIQDFTASNGEDRQSTLTWTNPADSDLDQVIVKRKTTGYPTSHTDGETRLTIDSAIPSHAETYTDEGLTNGQTYYYAVFSKDSAGNWNDDWQEGKNADTGVPRRAGDGKVTKYTFLLCGDRGGAFINSAEDLKSAFTTWWKVDYVKVYESWKSTKADLETALKQWCEQPDNDDLLIFCYAGHGLFGLIAPTFVTGEGTILYHPELSNWLHTSAATTIVILDACYSGSAVAGEQFTLREANRWVLTACDKDEESWGWDLLGLGWIAYQRFTKFFVDAISWEIPNIAGSDGLISLREAFDYSDGKCNSQLIHRQDPQVWPEADDFIVQPQREAPKGISSLFFGVFCAVDISIIDPNGKELSRHKNEIGSNAFRVEGDFNDDGENDVFYKIQAPAMGEYSVQVIPQPGASPSDTFTLLKGSESAVTTIAENVEISDIPEKPYILNPSTNTPICIALKLQFPDQWVTLRFDRVTRAGNTTLEIVDELPFATSPDIEFLKSFYQLNTTAAYTGFITIEIHYEDTGLNWEERKLALFKIAEDGTTTEITTDLDTRNNIITGRTDGLTYFGVGYPLGEGLVETVISAPNPVTDAGTAFFYTLPEGTLAAKLMVLSVAGRPLFETPLDVDSTRFPSAGTWNPVDQEGISLANGPYIYVLIADGKVIGQGKMVIQR